MKIDASEATASPDQTRHRRVGQSNCHDHAVPRFAGDAPGRQRAHEPVRPGGVGGPATPAVALAAANALAMLTGRRPRALPLQA